jgi:HTH-type transcriptional regulator/antitoxin MqsA
MMEKIYSPETGEELMRDVRRIEYEYKGVKFHADMPGWFPKENNNGIFTKDDMKVYSKALNRAKADAEHLLKPEEIRKTRKKLKLAREAAGLLLGGGHRAFQKYESGEILPSRAISNLLKLLYHKPDMLSLLKV